MSELSSESPNKKQRLGRGLGSLLGGANAAPAQEQPVPNKPLEVEKRPVSPPAQQQAQVASVPPESRIWNVAIDKLQPSEYQPRTHFDKEALEELSLSIKENGILQPIIARRLDGQRLEIIAGERRWRAAQLAGLHEVPVILKTLKNQAALEIAIIENIQREDLNPIEEAEAYQRLMNEFKLTQQQVSDKVGKERATVANFLRLLNLAPEVRTMVAKSEISAGHAKVLLGLQDYKEQTILAKKVREESLTVRQLEKIAQKKTTEAPSTQNIRTIESNVTQRLIAGLADELQKLLATKVQIDYTDGKGKISIQFYSDEELTQLIERLKQGCLK